MERAEKLAVSAVPAPKGAVGGRLNSLQRTMLQWNDLHPYNAVHVVRVRGLLDLGRPTRVVHAALESNGLSGLTLSEASGTYYYSGGRPACEVQSLDGGKNAPAVLAAEIERQLNTGFPVGGAFDPFRFFVVRESDSFSLGLVYFHAAADAEAVVALVRDIVLAYLQERPVEDRLRVDLYPECGDSLWWRRPVLLVRKLVSLPVFYRSLRRSHRVQYRDAQNTDNGYTFLTFGPELLGALRQGAKAAGVTVNDLVLALVLLGVAPLASRQNCTPGRCQLSVGAVVNIRKDLQLDRHPAFGLFLGSFVVTHAVPAGIGAVELAREIGCQTRKIKRARLYLGVPLELGIARFLFRLLSRRQRNRFYPKNYPLWGGVTNLNLDSLWESGSGTEPLDYFRAVSTGPVTPIVLSLTTVRDHMNISLTYRTTAFNAAQIEQLKRTLIETVSRMKGLP